MPHWIGASTAAQRYGLTYDQVVQAVMAGMVRGADTGSSLLVNPVDVEANLDKIRSFPPRFWAFKSRAARELGLTRNQIDTAIAMGLVRFKKVKNPNYSSGPEATLVAIPDLEANLDRIRSFSRYSNRELAAHHRHNVRRRLRERLAFRCPRCGEVIRPRLDRYEFGAIATGEADAEEARRDLIICHYYITHVDTSDFWDIDKWLVPGEVAEATGGEFGSYAELERWFTGRAGALEWKVRWKTEKLMRRLRAHAHERAHDNYIGQAVRMAAEDGLIDPEAVRSRPRFCAPE